ncbi:MAG: NAD-dependent epimerase/dehydratase family protein [Solirubrobacteraceae bacterium]
MFTTENQAGTLNVDCIVTGGAGFIGSNLVDALVARGDRVAVIDSLITGKRENLTDALAAGAQLWELDIRDSEAVERVFAKARPETVFHMAAQIDVRRSIEDPAADAAVNVLGTINILHAALHAGVARVVNTSTGGGLYGDAELLPTPEDHLITPLAPYGQSKLAAEGYCEFFDRETELSTVSLRYGNVYGPRQDVHGEAGVVAIFCGCLLDQRAPRIFGDGRQTRDWVEVADVVRANMLAAGSTVTGPVNIASGRQTSVLDLVGLLAQLGVQRGLRLPEPEHLPARSGEVLRSCLSADRARRVLGWHAQVPLAEGLRGILDRL